MKYPKHAIYFDISAGKYDSDGEENCKFCATFTDAEKAVKQYEFVDDYPWARLDLRIVSNDVTTTFNLLGDVDRYAKLRFDIARLWMKATGRAFIDVVTSVDVQLDDIEAALSSARPTWQVIKRAFDSGALSWTEAFEALMSECGYPMEEALQLLAENFDRRLPVEV